jgi:hypothetical protein
MELFLNLAWILIAGTMVCLWLRSDNRKSHDRRRQIIVILILIAILFPVISVSDDLLPIQNATEANNFHRRDLLFPSNPHPAQPMLAILFSVFSAGAGFAFLRFITLGLFPVKKPGDLASAALFNRPPPVA